MPGLIDLHVHLGSELRAGAAIESFQLEPAGLCDSRRRECGKDFNGRIHVGARNWVPLRASALH